MIKIDVLSPTSGAQLVVPVPEGYTVERVLEILKIAGYTILRQRAAA